MFDENDNEYALVCQSMVTILGIFIEKTGKALSQVGNAILLKEPFDDAGEAYKAIGNDADMYYEAIGDYIGEVKKIDEKFRSLKPSERMRFHQKSFRNLIDAHKRLSWIFYTSDLTTIAIDPRPLKWC